MLEKVAGLMPCKPDHRVRNVLSPILHVLTREKAKLYNRKMAFILI
ncbi:hypothetical protein L2D08_21480 [Domibacillus sp. PGB-M46]|nr:hypothetical protein [Domibacillus sp. PGB-M46]MCI2256904.1 hypothetical protein [Domibacillus sp. PGB-M46]